MIKKRKILLTLSLAFMLSFVLWTLIVRFVDVGAIGPNCSKVGLATLNNFVHNLFGVHYNIYVITDWLGILPILVAFCFAIVGLVQWIKRKSISKVDFDILALGVFYIVVIIFYVLFDFVVVNYRPVLINGYLEPSYPSSTTLLVASVMPTAIIQCRLKIKNIIVRRCVNVSNIIFISFMVIGRLISGVHWFSDIVGGLLLSTSLVLTYSFAINRNIDQIVD